MSKEKINNLSIKYDSTILESLKKMDSSKSKLLIVFKENKFYSVLSIGDIQRAIIQNIPLNSKIDNILREKITIAKTGDSFEYIKKIMLDKRIECMPVIDEEGEVRKLYFWNDVFGVDNKISKKFNLPVIIMAGGRGTRLKPLTNVLPKPLIPLGDKTILEEIINSFVDSGCSDFFISLNYKSDMVRQYFNNIEIKDANLHYFEEEKPLGTAGSLHLLKNKINTTFFVSNCDILVEQDYSEILSYHRENSNELTVVAALKIYPIPYGTIESGENGLLESITEKPELTFKINTGFYIMEPHLLDEIPKNEVYHITYLIEKLKKENRRIGVFPVSEKSWRDIGDWNEYLKQSLNRE